MTLSRGKSPGDPANPALVEALIMALEQGMRHLDLAEVGVVSPNNEANQNMI